MVLFLVLKLNWVRQLRHTCRLWLCRGEGAQLCECFDIIGRQRVGCVGHFGQPSLTRQLDYVFYWGVAHLVPFRQALPGLVEIASVELMPLWQSPAQLPCSVCSRQSHPMRVARSVHRIELLVYAAHLSGVALGALEVRAARAVVWGSHRSSPSRRAASMARANKVIWRVVRIWRSSAAEFRCWYAPLKLFDLLIRQRYWLLTRNRSTCARSWSFSAVRIALVSRLMQGLILPLRLSLPLLASASKPSRALPWSVGAFPAGSWSRSASAVARAPSIHRP